ncbi:Mpp10 domain-containing protein [Cephalotus follicularis]|uniref:U3 small nucleolar ribonucleoprotein protein MPP10 n=1 Tax=Cephalotus follicularis TaxID=3775 RepID=A0A1Q3ARK9_CEPFO|nr:Mpp10 domain-containing protein [Cephalotus follicularis]
METAATAGTEALRRLRSTEPPVWLAPDPFLAKVARTASQELFSCLKPFASKSPIDQLLIDGFDAEQIWQQIDLQSQPLLSFLRREIRKLEKNPEVIKKLKHNVLEGKEKKVVEEIDEDYDDDLDMDDDDDDDEEEEEEEEEEEDAASDERESEGEEKEREGGIEDKFLKIRELEEYLEDGEAKEYGVKNVDKKADNGGDADEEEEDDEDEDDELGVFGDDGNEDGEDEDANRLQNARYEDFFGSKNKKVPKRKLKLKEDSISGGEEEDDETAENKKKGGVSTYEKQLAKRQSEIEQMEKANLEPKAWTMKGEATAAERPKNSALEVDLDFEHNMRPAPVITEEVTASLEDIIQKRILEGRFDDVQKAPSIGSKAPKELKELDENKSKKGLAEIYETEYVKKTDPVSAPLTFSDEQKKEASMLFKKLCLKLDALSHFHFAPKPVIEDMSIQVNVPALAMEEIAPVAVSDAAMLAPEEVFTGKGDIKEEAELTQAEKKRRRANKKRKFKAVASKRTAKKATLLNHHDGQGSIISCYVNLNIEGAPRNPYR